jgi:hypothetical protein
LCVYPYAYTLMPPHKFTFNLNFDKLEKKSVEHRWTQSKLERNDQMNYSLSALEKQLSWINTMNKYTREKKEKGIEFLKSHKKIA